MKEIEVRLCVFFLTQKTKVETLKPTLDLMPKEEDFSLDFLCTEARPLSEFSCSLSDVSHTKKLIT